MAQTSLNSTGVASSGALSLQSNGTTEAIGISTGQVATLAQNPILTSGTANGVAYLNGSKVVTSGSALVFDGTNLGLGVTPSAWGTYSGVLDLKGNGSLAAYNQAVVLFANTYYNGTNYIYKTSTGAGYYQIAANQHQWYNAPSGTAGGIVSPNQAMTLDASGNLGVGSTSPNIAGVNKAITLNTTNGTSGAIYEIAVSGTNYAYLFANSSNTVLSSVQNLPLLFNTNNTERARIDSSGNLLVARTNASFYGGTVKLGVEQTSGAAWAFGVNANGNAVVFNHTSNTSSAVGSISVTTSATTYATSSDYRLKENITPMTGALSVVQQLKPCNYTWKVDGSEGQGFIAHELQEVVPDAVVGQKDSTRIEQYEISPAVPATFDEEGNELTPAVEAVMGEREVPAYQGIDTSFLVATLTAAIQEQQAIIESLTARITALEA